MDIALGPSDSFLPSPHPLPRAEPVRRGRPWGEEQGLRGAEPCQGDTPAPCQPRLAPSLVLAGTWTQEGTLSPPGEERRLPGCQAQTWTGLAEVSLLNCCSALTLPSPGVVGALASPRPCCPQGAWCLDVGAGPAGRLCLGAAGEVLPQQGEPASAQRGPGDAQGREPQACEELLGGG